MIEEVGQDLYRIPVPLEGSPLRELNSYLIRGDDRDLLIDTGFRRKSCALALEEGLRQLNSDSDRRDVLVTHFHTDHAGLADVMAGATSHIYMSQAELDYRRQNRSGKLDERTVERFRSEGFDQTHMDRLFDRESGNMEGPKFGDRLRGLEAHACLRYGRYQLEAIPVPGHTPGNLMLWAREQAIMFCGDHVLFDISPNITPYAGIEDSLGDYLDSLRQALAYPVRLALPGHRGSGDYADRIRQLLAHHDRRLEQVCDIVAEAPGLCAYEIAQRMRWKIRADSWEDFPIAQQWFAMGECMAHLDHLVRQCRLLRETRDGLVRYVSTVLA